MSTINIDAIYQATQDFTEHRLFLIQTVFALNAKTVLELGTDVGDSTRLFAEALQRTGGTLYTVDLQPPKWDERFMRQYYNVVIIQGDTVQIPWNQPIDVLFIDDHLDGMDTYQHVTQELVKYGPWVRVGGQILVHDTLHTQFGPGIQQALTEWTTNQALPLVNDCRQHGLGIIQITHTVPA